MTISGFTMVRNATANSITPIKQADQFDPYPYG